MSTWIFLASWFRGGRGRWGAAGSIRRPANGPIVKCSGLNRVQVGGEGRGEGGKSGYTVCGMFLHLWALTVSSGRAGILVSFVPTLFPTPRKVLGT